MDGQTIVETIEKDANNTNPDELGFDPEFYPDQKWCYYQTDNSYLVLHPDYVFFKYEDIISDNQILMIKLQTVISNNITDLDLLFKDGELPNYSRSEAVEKVDNIIEELDIKNTGTPRVYAVTPEEINDKTKDRPYSEDKNGEPKPRPEVGENDGIYIIQYPMMYGNVQMAEHETPCNEKMSPMGSNITAIVSKEKLVYFDFGFDGADAAYNEGEMIPFKYDAKAALDVLVKEYSKKIIDQPTEIYSCKPVYLLTKIENDKNWTFSPMWEFGCLTRNEKGELTKHYYEYVKPDLGVVYDEYL